MAGDKAPEGTPLEGPQEGETVPLQLFLSHASPDVPFINSYLKDLVEQHFPGKVFYSPVDLRVGDWHDEVVRALQSSTHFLVVVSRQAVSDRKHVKAEAEVWQIEHDDFAGVIPVVIDDAPSRGYQIYIRLPERQQVDFKPPPGDDAVQRLIDALRSTPPVVPVSEKTRVTEINPGLRRAYLRWLAGTQEAIEVTVAGRRITAPLAAAPMPDRLVEDPSSHFGKEQELDHLAHRNEALRGVDPDLDADAAEARVLSEQPLPLYWGPKAGLDAAVLDGETWTVDDVVRRSWRTVVLGDPGSGKSTIARRIVRDVADARLSGPEVPGPLDRLPILCRASDLALLLAEDEEAPVEELAVTAGWDNHLPSDPDSGDLLPAAELQAMVRREAQARRLLLVVDGLDEVPTRADRTLVVEALTEFAARGGAVLGTPDGSVGSQVIATSRIVGYHATRFSGEQRFEHLMLPPLSRQGSDLLASFWLDAHAAELKLPEARRRTFGAAVDRLLTDGGHTADLVANPFLLVAAISALVSGRVDADHVGHRWLRTDLYDAALEDAIDRALDRVATGRLASFDRDADTELQLAVAHEMQEIAPTGITDATGLDGAIAAAADSLGRSDVEELRHILLDGLGLITERGKDLYGFLHRSIGEHLAGRWLVRDDEAPARIAAHLGDTQWVEVLRLGLEDLSRHDPGRFDALADELLAGSEGWLTAVLLVSAAKDLDHLTGSQLAAIIGVLAQGSGTVDEAARLVVDLARAMLAVEEQETAIVGAIRDAILSDSPAETVVAARAVHILELDAPELVAALFAKQEQDGPDTGWETTATLQALLSAAAHSTDEAGADAAAIVAGLSAEDRELLAAITVPDATMDRAVGAPGRRRKRRRAGLTRDQMPMRSALLGDEPLLARVRASIPLTRLMLCLYGGCDHADLARWRGDQQRLEAQLDSGSASDANRALAARLLDVEVAAHLRRSEDPPGPFQPELISAESPLTPLLLQHLRADTPPDELAAVLLEQASDAAAGPALQGDALAGWLALDPAGDGAAALTAAINADGAEAISDRVRWRMGRAAYLASDLVSRVTAGTLVSGFAEGAADPRTQHVLAAVGALGRVRNGGFDPFAHHIRSWLPAAVEAHPDALYNMAVTLDTQPIPLAGDPEALVHILAEVHLGPGVHVAVQNGWELDPLGPARAAPVGEALAAVAALPPRFDFFACWLIARLAGPVIEAGHGGEALAIVLDRLPTEREGAVAALEALERAGLQLGVDPELFSGWRTLQRSSFGDVPLPPVVGDALRTARTGYAVVLGSHLGLAADGDPAIGPAVRGLLRLSAGDPAGLKAAAAGTVRISDPLERLRALELALDLGVRPEDPARTIVRTLEKIADPADRALARLRLSRRLPGVQAAELVTSAVEDMAAVDGDMERAGLLASARTVCEMDAATAARWAELVDQLAAPECRAQARGRHAPALLGVERFTPDGEPRGAAEPKAPVPWAGLTLGAVALDALAVLDQESGGRDLWDAVTDPARRDGAAAAIYTRGLQRRWALTPPVARAIDQLCESGAHETAALLLPVVDAPRDPAVVQRWRESDDEAVSRRATLLAVQSGHLDAHAASLLPSLLADSDDLVRIAAAIACAGVARGGSGSRFRLRDCGPEVVAELARAYHRAASEDPHVASELMWCLNDIAIDSLDGLRAVLAALEGEPGPRTRLLASISRVDAAVCPSLLQLAGELGGAELTALLGSVLTIAQDPARWALTRADIEPLAAPVLRLLTDETESDAVLLAATSAYAWLTTDNDLGVLEDLLDDEVPAIAAAAALGLASAVSRRGDPDRATTQAHELLMRADGAPDVVAAGLIGGFVRLGGEPEETCTYLEPWAVVRGLLAAFDESSIGIRYWRGIRRARRFVLHPAHLAGEAAAAHAAFLLGGLADELTTALGALRDSGWTPAPGGVSVDEERPYFTADLVALLAEVSLEQPAAVRRAVREHPALADLLAQAAVSASSWLIRLSAVTVTGVLGDGSATAVEAILRGAADSNVVSDAALTSCRWLESVDDEGFELLLDGLSGARGSDVHAAVTTLTSLAQNGALDGAQRRRTLAAVREAVEHTDPGRRVLAERSEKVVEESTLVEELAAALASLVAGDEPAGGPGADAGRGLVLQVPLGSGEGSAAVAITQGLLPNSPVEFQERLQDRHRGDHLDSNITSALSRLGAECKTGAQTLEALVMLQEQAPDTEEAAS